MEKYLIDRETLEKFVDELMKKRTLPVNTVEEMNSLKEEMIKNLDDRIGEAIFGRLSEEQLDEVNQLMDQEDATEETFREFFDKTGLNIEEIMSDTAEKFSQEFIGGTNA